LISSRIKDLQHYRVDRLRTNNLDILLEVEPPVPVVSDRIFGLTKEVEVRAEALFKVMWSFTSFKLKQIFEKLKVKLNFYINFKHKHLQILFIHWILTVKDHLFAVDI